MDVMGKVRGAIKKLEQHLKVDLQYILKGGFWLSTGNSSSSLILLLLSLAYANLLSKQTYGEYKYILSLCTLFSCLTLTGTNNSVTQAVARGFEGTYERSIGWQLRWSILYAVAVVGTGVYYVFGGNPHIGYALVAAGLINPFSLAFNTYIAFLNGRKDFKSLAAYNLLSSGFVATVSFATVIFFPQSFALVLANAAGNAVINLIIHLRTVQKFKPNEKVDEKAFSFAKHLSVLNIMGTISGQIDSILVFHFLGAAQLAVYTFSTIFPDRLRGFTKVLQNLALPKFSQQEHHVLRTTLPSKLWKFILLLVGLAAAYALLAPVFFHLLLPQYGASILLSQVYAISLVFGASTIPVAVMLAQRQQKNLYIFSGTAGAFQILMSVLLIPTYGLMGAVVAKILSGAYNLVLSYALAFKKERLPS
ncbi:MAG: oligosaccharide flippase family protein [Patescibacteria group bacterium]